MSKQQYIVHLEPDEDGGYTVTVPALPGCVTWGKDLAHAEVMAQECIEGFIEALAKAGEPIPVETAPVSVDIVVEVAVPHAA